MIKEHKDFPNRKLSDNDIVWKYMSFEKFAFLVFESKLHFQRLDSFEDQTEGKLSMVDKQLFLYTDEDKAYWEKEAKRHFASCWILSPRESSLMWNSYAKNGIAIKATVGSIKESMQDDTEHECYISPVKYIDEEAGSSQDDATPLNVLKICFTKRKYYQQEQELRILHSIYEPIDEKQTGEDLPIKLRTLIGEIVISPYAGKFLLGTVNNLLQKAEVKVSVRMSNMCVRN